MTTIEWTQRPGTKGESWNPIRARNLQEARSAAGATGKENKGGLGHFCEHVSEGCRNCYAERLQPRFRNPIRYARQDRDRVEILLDEPALEAPLRWRKPRTVFVCSMTDLFGEWVEEAWLDAIFAVMALTPRHTYQVLTKRPERMRGYLMTSDRAFHVRNECLAFDSERWDRQRGSWPLLNVWLGVSVEDQAAADQRIPPLLDTPAAVRFVSYEPALGPVDFERGGFTLLRKIKSPTGKLWPGLDWVIAGGESGSKARPADPAWFRDVRDLCADTGVAFFFKQWGEWRPNERAGPDCRQRLGKKAAGRVLDGREHSAWPR